MDAGLECSHLVLDFLKRHKYDNSVSSFLLECPFFDIDEKPHVEETLEEIVEHRKNATKFKREWEEFGQGQLLNQLCTKLQEDIEEIKDFMVGAHKMNEKTTSVKNRSRSMRRSQNVNLMHPLTVSTVQIRLPKAPTPTSPLSVLPSASGVNSKSKSPFKRKPVSPQKRPPQILSSLSSLLSAQPLLPPPPSSHVLQPPINPSQPGPSTSLASQPNSAQHSQQVEIEHVIEKMLSDQGLHQKIADSINHCASVQPDDSDSFIQTVLNQVTQEDPSLGQILDSAATSEASFTSQSEQPTAAELERRSPPLTTQANIPRSQSQTPLSQVTPTVTNSFNSGLSIDLFLDQLHKSTN